MARTCVATVLVCLSLAVQAEAAIDATLFRLFFRDGSSVVSFGEFARVADRVVFSMPVGGPADAPRLHVVAISAALVDWPRTDRYADAARAQRYAETRGEADWARLTEDVARVLNEIWTNTNRSRALAYAEEARRTLAEWPAAHFGYRQRDIREFIALLDESISDLRASLGVSSFDLALVAVPAPPEQEPLLGMPTLREQIDQGFRVAALADRVSERVALLQATPAMIGDATGAVPARELSSLRRDAETLLAEEARVDGRYADLTRRMLERAGKAAARVDIREVERLIARVPREDERLGRKRPEAVQALTSSLNDELDTARRLQLLVDRWTIRRALYRDYYRSVSSQLDQLVGMQSALESIKRQEGPAARSLVALRGRLAGGGERLNRIQPAADLQALHGTIMGAWRFAENALNIRFDAINTGDLLTSREASSAAAGALMLLARAQEEVRALLEPPTLR